MFTSRSRFFTLAIAALAIAASALTTTFDRVAAACSYAYRAARDLVVGAVAKFKQPALRLVARAIELVQAYAYALRLAKRERSQVRSQWRMCPST